MDFIVADIKPISLTDAERKMIWFLCNNVMNQCLDNHVRQETSLKVLGNEKLRTDWNKETLNEVLLLQSIKQKVE